VVNCIRVHHSHKQLRYFASYFHSFDAIVIVAGFIVDVLLHGILEEVASLVIVLRLWRFFKIIEEFSVGAQEQMDGLELRIESLESENKDLKERLRKSKGNDEESEIGI
jgi:voltage-gated hydrogen channel 1